MPTLIITPHLEPGGYHTDRFAVGLLSSSEPLGKPTRRPIYDTARILQARGLGSRMLRFRHAKGPAKISCSGLCSELARWTVEELKRQGLRRVPWREVDYTRFGKPGDISGSSSGSGSASGDV